MEKIVPVLQLSSSAVTRPRGREAFTRLVGYLDDYESVQIDLRSTELISSSFLDEVVLSLKAMDVLDRVVFLVTDLAVRQRLANIAAVRDAQIFYRTHEKSPKEIILPHEYPGLELKRAKA
ncbi:MAG TPA: hypothetical protein VGH16_11365 [Candidatus Binatia bacterium]|jgi:hypothetical protein